MTPSRSVLTQACDVLAERDPYLAKAYTAIGVPDWRSRTADYETLARIVVYQLISTKAADAIWARTCALLGMPVRAEAVLAADIDALRACGLSRPKVEHMRAIARALQTGELNLERLAGLTPDAARTKLLNVRGIGPWSADLFLLSAYGVLDAFPSGDVGHLEAYRRLSSANMRLDGKAFVMLAENWRPFRGVAAHLLWGWLNAERDKA